MRWKQAAEGDYQKEVQSGVVKSQNTIERLKKIKTES